MREIQNKLRSERGASISFALLLFLVCATVGSIVLAAATASSGRLSRLAESDQRYYAVTSAAELLKDRFDGETVTVVRTETATTTTIYDYSGRQKDKMTDSSREPLVTVNGAAAGGEDSSSSSSVPGSLLEDAAYRLYLASNEAAADTSSSFPVTTQMTLAADDSSGDFASLPVSVTETLAGDGTITLILRGTGGDADSSGSSGSSGASGSAVDTYSLRLIFEADQTTRTQTRTVDGTPQEIDEEDYSVTSVTTTTVTTATTWQLTGIDTLVGTGD